MTRAAIAPCGDPFVALLFLHNFKTVWYNEVDKLYVCFNCSLPSNVTRYIEKRFRDPKIVWIHYNYQLGHADALRECFDVCVEDTIVILEDDVYIYKKGMLNKHFAKIENGDCDIVASPRGNCSVELFDFCMKKFGNPNFPLEINGPHFFPSLFFVKRKDLLRTDLNFDCKKFPKGEYIKELDWTPLTDQDGDTFIWLSIQLKSLGLKCCYVPQCRMTLYLGHEEDIPDFGWVHVGGLCQNGPLLRGNLAGLPDMQGASLWDYENRVVFWTIAVNLESYDEIEGFKREYLHGIEAFFSRYGMDKNKIAEKVEKYRKVYIEGK